MRKTIWTVQYPTPPHAAKYCKKCGRKTEFYSSGQFRVNAQRKYLDIWLIYKCKHCETTWNATVCSRVSPQSMPSGLLEQFSCNDHNLAKKYAMDINFLRKNSAEIILPDFYIQGDSLHNEKVQLLEIRNQYPLPIKLSGIIRKSLNLSQRQYLNLIKAGQIKSSVMQNLQKYKLNSSIVLEIYDYEMMISSSSYPQHIQKTDALQARPGDPQ